jgi:hypothetical protein
MENFIFTFFKFNFKFTISDHSNIYLYHGNQITINQSNNSQNTINYEWASWIAFFLYSLSTLPISNLCPSIVRRRLQFVKTAKRYFTRNKFSLFAMALNFNEISPHRENFLFHQSWTFVDAQRISLMSGLTKLRWNKREEKNSAHDINFSFLIVDFYHSEVDAEES